MYHSQDLKRYHRGKIRALKRTAYVSITSGRCYGHREIRRHNLKALSQLAHDQRRPNSRAIEKFRFGS